MACGQIVDSVITHIARRQQGQLLMPFTDRSGGCPIGQMMGCPEVVWVFMDRPPIVNSFEKAGTALKGALPMKQTPYPQPRIQSPRSPMEAIKVAAGRSREIAADQRGAPDPGEPMEEAKLLKEASELLRQAKRLKAPRTRARPKKANLVSSRLASLRWNLGVA